ncbi:hypothetical protein LR69_00964 [Geobacillus sp. BCO2]|nr:hypothetical protein LR69_00964 [Geobacillus sp. BCO2]
MLFYADGDRAMVQAVAEAELLSPRELHNWCQRLPQGAGWEAAMAALEAPGFTDIQKRLLAYFLEREQREMPGWLTAEAKGRLYGRMAAAIEARRRWKRKKLQEMDEWVNLSSCRRQALVRAFGEELTGRRDVCCDRCGLSLDGYGRAVHRPEAAPVRHWREELWDMLFGEGRTNEAAK